MNKMGFCISYDELERIDQGLAQRAIDAAEENRVPIPELINNSNMIHGAMDNFDHTEATLSGLGTSHHTILVLFQSGCNPRKETHEISKVSDSISRSKKSINHVLECQKLLHMGRFGDLPSDFKPGECSTAILTASSNKTYKPWILLRHVTAERTPSLSNFDSSQIPSFRSLLTPNIPTVTSIAFTPIYPIQPPNMILSTPQ